MLHRAWIVLEYIDCLEVQPVSPFRCYRIIPLQSKSEFSAAPLCIKYSIILYNAAILARDFPYDVTGVDLITAFDEFRNRTTIGGAGDRPRPDVLRDGLRDRIGLYGYDFAWQSMAVARSLITALNMLVGYWLDRAEQNKVLNDLNDGSFAVGSISATSHTVGVLGACATACQFCAFEMGQKFFTGEEMSGDRDGTKRGWKKIIDGGLANHLPCIEKAKWFSWNTTLRDESRACLRRIRIIRKKGAPKSLSPPVVEATPDMATGSPKAPAVVLNGQGSPVIVLGKEKEPVTAAQYDVLVALLDAPNGLAKDALAKNSRHTDAVKILKRIAKIDADWAAVIGLAGKPNGRYRIRSPH